MDVSSFSVARGEDAYIDVDGDRERTQLFIDVTITTQLGTEQMAFLDPSQVWRCSDELLNYYII